MKKPKLIEGLLMLEKEEWISFRKYILMYCTKFSDNYRLLDYLFSVRNTLGEWKEIESIKSPFFEKMSDKSFLNLMSRIFIWFEEWLVWYENKKEKNANDIQLVKIYNQRGVFDLADKTYRRVEQKLLDKKQLDLRKHRDLFLLHHNHYFCDNPVKYKRHGEILESLMSYFFLQLKEQAFVYVSELHNWGLIQNHDYSKEIEMISQLGVMIDDSQVSKVIELIIQMVSKLDDEAFLELRDVIYSKQIDPNSEFYIIAAFYMVHFSMKLWNSNVIKDSQLVLDAQEFGLESGVLLKSGKIPFVRFMNLISALGYIKTSEKMYAFIDKWKHVVGGESEESIQALGYAQLKFIEEKLDDIIPLLIGKKYETPWGKMQSALLELIGLYNDRINNYHLLMNRLNNYKRVLRTYGKRRSKLEYLSLLNFSKVLDLLIKRDFMKLTIKVENYSPIIYKNWVVKELKAGQI